ncbi:hypothetical protein LQ318_05030 [Aliifodinibius salicampi]|uniref:CcmD family protein n=1 Tax=Fodinibius salicampi TaxID=1920655 RepID=A0ABT3PWN6_9BACT|nr:hypothetical protein [Fodinibius salicampi]MCW9712266.1 hypothetical protein [Fodinibius salicampi]
MIQHFTGLAILSSFIYLLVVGVVLWFIYRFVIAHESMAESLKKIERQFRKGNKE